MKPVPLAATPAELAEIVAEGVRKPRLRIGLGFDVHGFAEERPLVLGGVTIPAPRGLLGHSDADVVAHALADALLGAARAGDIGEHFPDDDPAYEGADSLKLLQATADLVRSLGFAIIDADIVIAAQTPKLSLYRDEMRTRLAAAMSVEKDSVGLKASTTEHLGFVGREEGIAVWATCLLEG